MKDSTKTKNVKTPSFYTCPIETGGKRTLGVKDSQLKELGRNRAKIANQFGRSK